MNQLFYTEDQSNVSFLGDFFDGLGAGVGGNRDFAENVWSLSSTFFPEINIKYMRTKLMC